MIRLLNNPRRHRSPGGVLAGRFRHQIGRFALLVCCLSSAMLGWATERPDDETAEPKPAPAKKAEQPLRPDDEAPAFDPVRTQTLIDQLGAPTFADREAATTELLEIGSPALELLSQNYRAKSDWETRLRIQEIVEYVFFWDELFSRVPFLGLKYQNIRDHHQDHRVPTGQGGIPIRRVLAQSSAQRAGLQRNDLIVAVDGDPLPEDMTRNWFGQRVEEAAPGTRMTLTIYRGPDKNDVPVVLGVRPLVHYTDAVHRQLLTATAERFARYWQESFGTELQPQGRKLWTRPPAPDKSAAQTAPGPATAAPGPTTAAPNPAAQ